MNRGDEYKFAILVPKIDLVGLDRTGYYPLGQAVIHRGVDNFRVPIEPRLQTFNTSL